MGEQEKIEQQVNEDPKLKTAAEDEKVSEKKLQKKWKKILRNTLLTIAAVLLIIIIFRDTLIKTVGCAIGSWVIGTDISMEEFDTSLFAGSVTIKNLKIASPENFSEPTMVSLGHLHADVGVLSLLSNRIVIEKVLVENLTAVGEFNSEGKLNISVLNKDIQSRFGSAGDDKEKESAEKSEQEEDETTSAPGLLIKELDVDITATLFDSRSGVRLNFPLRYSDTDILIEETSFAELFNNINEFVVDSCGTLANAGGAVINVGKDALETTTNAAESVVKDAKKLLNFSF